MTTALFLLRCVELGLSTEDLENLDVGMVLDMFTEKSNDDVEYSVVAEQKNFDAF